MNFSFKKWANRPQAHGLLMPAISWAPAWDHMPALHDRAPAAGAFNPIPGSLAKIKIQAL
ncbi:hypothetical protein [[Acidovorax] ebreus]|uniref:hypothetical protein n=1 Tax=Diaphorobacter sp. LI3 TaxID=2952886 RepID=UPI0020601042|nr:hypothetical protein MRB47_19130 [Diaphorobacter sp. LI3]